MLNPIANGTNPNTVVIAVSNTGRRRVFPAWIVARINSSLESGSSSFKPSSSRLFFCKILV